MPKTIYVLKYTSNRKMSIMVILAVTRKATFVYKFREMIKNINLFYFIILYLDTVLY